MISRIGVQRRQRHTQKQATTRQNANLVSSEPPLCRESWVQCSRGNRRYTVSESRSSSKHRTAAVDELCQALNDTHTVYPGTDLTLRYSIKSHR